MAIIGTYLVRMTHRQAGSWRVFVFGIILGNKESFGFRMNLREHKKLQEYVARDSYDHEDVHIHSFWAHRSILVSWANSCSAG